ncbi:hypothetical protein [Thalassolituus oleivorans]|uniref:Uncharacterized protein n=1 Tax=Thalassolituus oleivorans MIL-1 TaxID=1298593 RepID=M5DN88_9GAMM|nr:hypothetical protein [Thalassolituus oleivorans]CCU70896.1 hypothetical protein TOL_0457 [Thalassolituus oleivorans MIL-1]
MIKSGKGLGKKPAHIAAAASSQDVIWQAIRELKTFTTTDLICHIAGTKYTGINDHTVKSYVQRLMRGHYLTVIDSTRVRGHCVVNTYQLRKDPGIHAPRLDKYGNESVMGVGRACMWRVMKIVDEFDANELAALASTDTTSVKLSEAKNYIGHLHRAGYLHCTRLAKNSGGLARYKLIPSKNTGPRPPQVQRVHSIYDPNLAQVVWPKSHTEVLIDALK